MNDRASWIASELHDTSSVCLRWRAAWPLVLIAVGALVVYRAMTGQRTARFGMVVVGDKDKLQDAPDAEMQTVDVTAVLGGFERRAEE